MKWLIFPALLAFSLQIAQAGDTPSVLVKTMSANRGTLDITLPVHGTVQAAPNASITVSFLHGGQIAKLETIAGQTVAQGDPLLEFAADPAAALAYQQASNALAFARTDRAHTQALFEQKLVTRSQLDQAEKAVRDAEDGLRAQASIGGAKAIETIRAPFAGIVTEVTASNGDRIQPNVSVLRLTRADGLIALCGVTQEDRASLKADQEASFEGASPDKPIAGTVSGVGGMLDAKTQLASVIIAFPPEISHNLLPGQHLSGAITTGHVAGWIVPRQAVLSDDDGAYLFQTSGDKAVRISVMQLAEAGEQLAVDGKLDQSLPIVVEGNYQLKDGMAVRVGESASSKAEPK